MSSETEVKQAYEEAVKSKSFAARFRLGLKEAYWAKELRDKSIRHVQDENARKFYR